MWVSDFIFTFFFILGIPSLLRPRTAAPLRGSHVVHCGIVEDSAMTLANKAVEYVYLEMVEGFL